MALQSFTTVKSSLFQLLVKKLNKMNSPSGVSENISTAEKSRGFITDVVLNAVEPGVNISVLIFINAAFVLLLVTVAVVLLLDFSVLLLSMGVLAAGLMVGVNV